MKIRVRMDLLFDADEIAEADKLYTAVDAVKAKLRTIPSGERKPTERSFVEIHRCYHDEVPVRPCEPIKRIDAAVVEV